MVTDKSSGFSHYSDSTTTTTGGNYTTYTWPRPVQADRGWICPRCGKANAPWVRSCDCYPNTDYTITWTT